jgi:hypothetical protein
LYLFLFTHFPRKGAGKGYQVRKLVSLPKVFEGRATTQVFLWKTKTKIPFLLGKVLEKFRKSFGKVLEKWVSLGKPSFSKKRCRKVRIQCFC